MALPPLLVNEPDSCCCFLIVLGRLCLSYLILKTVILLTFHRWGLRGPERFNSLFQASHPVLRRAKLLTLCSHNSSTMLPMAGKEVTVTWSFAFLKHLSFEELKRRASFSSFCDSERERKELTRVKIQVSHIPIPNSLYLLSSFCRWRNELAQYHITLKGVNLSLGHCPSANSRLC